MIIIDSKIQLIITLFIFVKFIMLCSLIKRSPISFLLFKNKLIANVINIKQLKAKQRQTVDLNSQQISTNMPTTLPKETSSHIQQLLYSIGKQMLSTFQSKISQDNKKIAIKELLEKHQAKMNQLKSGISFRQLLTYIEIVKNMCFHRFLELQYINIIYQSLETFMTNPQYQKVMKSMLTNLWRSQETPLIIRSVCFVQYMDDLTRQIYLQKIVPYVKYFKTTEIMVMLYQKWKYNFKYPYRLLDQLYKNDFFINVEKIGQAYIKMKFIQTNKGDFCAIQDLNSANALEFFRDRPQLLAHTDFKKYLQILQSQSFFGTTNIYRTSMQHFLNLFINMAKNQSFDEANINLTYLVQIYLAFDQSRSSGQLLLNEITYFAKITKFQIKKKDFEFYRKFLMSVLKNINKQLKYERIDYLNKQFTNDTINFLRFFIPKYMKIWPQVIFQINDAAHQLFVKSTDALLKQFQAQFGKYITNHSKSLTLKNQKTKKVLSFLKCYKSYNLFVIPQKVLLNLLQEFSKKKVEDVTQGQLQILNIIIQILPQTLIAQNNFIDIMKKLQNDLIEAKIKLILAKPRSQSQIRTYQNTIIWLALYTAKIRSFGLRIDQALLEQFINEKLYFMINSLTYLQVYYILNFTLTIKRLYIQVYERLLVNLSTFLIFINEKRNKQHVSPFYLNQIYKEYYRPICTKILENARLMKQIPNKNAFRIFQIILFKNIENITNRQFLIFVDVISDPTFLNVSLLNHLSSCTFLPQQIQQNCSLQTISAFSYYNKSFLQFSRKKSNQAEIKNKFKSANITQYQMQSYFLEMQVYKTILMDSQIDLKFDIPEPFTDKIQYKLMYICHKIYQKIKRFQNYDFKAHLSLTPDGSYQVSQVDLQLQKYYIDKQALDGHVTYNNLRMQQNTLPRYIKFQVWKNYVFTQKDLSISTQDIYLKTSKLSKQIMTKIIKSVCGNFMHAIEVIKQFNYNQELKSAIQQANITYKQIGASLNIYDKQQDKPSLMLICSTSTNYKLLYICAHVLALNDRKIAIIKENQSVSEVVDFLKQYFQKDKKQQAEKQMQQQIKQVEKDQ